MTCPQMLGRCAILFGLILASTPSGQAAESEIELSAPKDGEKWALGSKHFVSWKAPKLAESAQVSIEFSNDGGKKWTSNFASPNSAGKALIELTGRNPGSMLVRAVAANGGGTSAAREITAVPSQAANYEWKKITTTAAWAPRDGAGTLVYKDRLWMLGGWNPDPRYRKEFFPRICNNEVWTSKDGADWSLVRANTFKDATFKSDDDWEGRHTAGYVVHQDKMWIVGGDCNQGHYQSDVWNSTDGKVWNHVNKGKPVPWGPRCLHYTVVHNNKIWVIGGQTVPQFAKADEAFHRDVWNSSDGIEWTKVEPKEPYWPQRGMIGGGVVLNGRIWILGGGTYDTPKIPSRKFMNDVWSSADGVDWTQHTAAAPWHPRQYHDVGVFDGRMWVLEGYAVPGGNRNDVWYSADGVNWYEVPNTPWKPRHAAGVYTYENGLWMVGGNNMEPDAWKLVRVDKAAQ